MVTEIDYLTKWQQVLSSIRMEIGKTSFETWFSKIHYKSTKNGVIYLCVDGYVAKDWITSRYLFVLEQKFSELCGSPHQICLIVKEKASDYLAGYSVVRERPAIPYGEVSMPPMPPDSPKFRFVSPSFFEAEDKQSEAKQEDSFRSQPLDPRYTFETFVIGESNRFAHAACYAVGQTPGKAYNPLYIYGGVGLGKTHLLHAIGQQIVKNHPSFNVVYVSCEQFTNELIDSIREEKTQAFRDHYRTCDVLLIDDIQFLAGKERTQEELFHTFNALYSFHKQIILSSDCPPKYIPALTERLRSRFEWGLITDIHAPDYETRMAILTRKILSDSLLIPSEVSEYLAEHIQSNIRELEGALIRLVAYSQVSCKPITLELTREAFSDILPPETKLSLSAPKALTIRSIQEQVCTYFNLDLQEFLSKKRNRKLVLPRHIAMYLCRTLTDYSLPVIGQEFGGRDHSTVVYAVKKIEDTKSTPEVKKALRILKQKLAPVSNASSK